MSNLTRYSVYLRNDGHQVVAMMVPYASGDYVKFDDIKELLNTDAQQLKPKMPRVEDIINDVVGTQISMHDQAVVAGINECYRYISRHFGH